MLTLCWAAKGGSGTTVVTATLALESTRPALLVDLAGDVPAVLGMAEPDRPGVSDWLASDGADARLADLLTEIDDLTSLLPHRRTGDAVHRRPDAPDGRWRTLVGWLEAWATTSGGEVWIDAGTGTPPAALADRVDRRWLITRSCYLALRAAARGAVRPTGVVLVEEPGRALRPCDVERSLAAPITARLVVDPRVARSVDSGLLVSRPPLAIRRSLRRAVA